MLALDGGGIRGVLTLQILKSIETQLGTKLCDYFDYIAGTSTGAIIAAGLSIGKSVDELIDFYRETGTEMFQQARYLARLNSLYQNGPLQQKLQEVFEQRDLKPGNLKTLLLAVTQNVTTDSPWPISSNPEARYNLPERDDCNPAFPRGKSFAPAPRRRFTFRRK
jgi:patatin-like phospholipase/acyl hydrolase